MKIVHLAQTVNLQIFGKLSSGFFIVQLLLRLWIGNIFWKSGLTKIGNWETTVSLFADEYKVPLLSPNLAALMATGVELAAPLMLLFGLATRINALALLVMTAVIEFSYMSFPAHQAWALVLLVLLTTGAGKLSIDHLLLGYFNRKAT